MSGLICFLAGCLVGGPVSVFCFSMFVSNRMGSYQKIIGNLEDRLAKGIYAEQGERCPCCGRKLSRGQAICSFCKEDL